MERLHGSHDKSEKRAILRLVYRTDLYALLRFGLNIQWIEHQFFFERCQEFQESPDHTLDLWFRGAGKSTIINRGGCLQAVLASHGEFSPDERQMGLPRWAEEITIGIFSHSNERAEAFLAQIMRDLENPALVSLYPDILFENPSAQSPQWSVRKGLIVKRKTNPKEPTLGAHGLVNSQPTGVHYGLLVFDDVVDADSVTTAEQIRKTTESWEYTEYLKGPPGIERYVGTIYSHADTYSVIRNSGRVHQTRIRPATRSGRPPTEDTSVLKPQDELLRSWQQNPHKFSCQMLLNPTLGTSSQFQEQDLQYYDETFDAAAIKAMNRYVFVDPADAQHAKADYTAGFVVGLAEDQNVYVLAMMRDRLNLIARGNLVFDWDRRFSPRKIYYEGNNHTDLSHFELRGKQENYNIVNRITRLVRNRVSRGKMERIEGLLPWFADRRIYLPRKFQYKTSEGETVDLVEIFCDEYRKYPRGHDDQLDALSQLADPDVSLVWPKPKIRQDAYDREDDEPYQSWVTR